MLADLHTHTNTSHGHHSAAEMYEGALRPDDIATRPAVLAQALDYLDGPLPRLRFSL